jgi:hypothetical protein
MRLYTPPLYAKFVDTWTQPHKPLPVYGLAVSSGLACVQRELDMRSHAVVTACYPHAGLTPGTGVCQSVRQHKGAGGPKTPGGR